MQLWKNGTSGEERASFRDRIQYVLAVSLFLTGSVLATVGPAQAQDADTSADAETLDDVVVEAEREKLNSLIEEPPKANPGGHTADGMKMGPLGNLQSRDIPFSFTSYTDTAVEDRQPVSIQGFLESDPSVQRETARNTYFSGIEVRGLGASYVFNGQPGVYARDMVPSFEQFSRIELMKGPNSFVTSNSPADVGGLVNLVPKRATSREVTNMTFTKLPGNATKYHLDLGKRFGEGDAFGIRVNTVTEDGELNVDNVERERNSFAIALDHRGENHRITLDLEQTDRTTHGAQPWFSVASISSVPDAPNQDRTYGQPWANFDQEFQSMVLQGEYDLTSNWTAGAAYSKVLLSEFGQWQGFATFSNLNGDYSWFTNSNWTGEYDYDTYRAYLKGSVRTGGITHNLSLTGVHLHNVLEGQRGNSISFNSNVNDPVYVDEPSIDGRRVAPWTEDKNDFVSVGDRMEISDNLDVIAGLQWADLTAVNSVLGDRVSSDEVSPLAGVNFDYSQNWTLYTSYAESLEPGEEAPGSATNAGESTDPSITENLQLGGKFAYGELSGDLALFQTEKANTFTKPSGVFGQFGRRENQGVELTFQGKPRQNLNLTGGVTWMDAELVKKAGGTNEGNHPIASPEWKGSVNAEYNDPSVEGLTYNGALNYTGSQFQDEANTKEVPSFATADLGAKYHFDFDGTPMTSRLQVKNVTDERYWNSSTIGLMPGNPRSIYLSLKANF